MNKINPKVLLFTGVLCISISGTLIKSASAPSTVLALYRLIWTMILLLPYALLTHRQELFAVTKRELISLILSGMFLGFHFATYFGSLSKTTVANVSVLSNTEVLFTALGACFLLKEHIPKKGVLGIIISFLGVMVILMGNTASAGSASYIGNALALLCAVFISAYNLIGRTARKGNMSTVVYTTYVYFTCMLTLLAINLIKGETLTGYEPKNYLIALVLTIFCTFMGHSIFSTVFKYLNPAYVCSVKLLSIVLSPIIAMIVLGEIPTVYQIVSAVIIICGVALYTKAENSGEESSAAVNN